MVTSNAIQRTVHIRYAGQIATAFFIDVDSRQNVVTAKHVVPDLQGEVLISILHNKYWRDVSVHLVGHAPGEADIALLYRIAGADLTLPPNAAGLTVGQDAFFSDFPFGLFGEMGSHTTTTRFHS